MEIFTSTGTMMVLKYWNKHNRYDSIRTLYSNNVEDNFVFLSRNEFSSDISYISSFSRNAGFQTTLKIMNYISLVFYHPLRVPLWMHYEKLLEFTSTDPLIWWIYVYRPFHLMNLRLQTLSFDEFTSTDPFIWWISFL